MKKSAATASLHSGKEGGLTSDPPSAPGDLDVRLASIEKMVREIYSALFSEEACVKGGPERKNLLPYNSVRYQAALIEARGGNHKALQQYLKKYHPRPGGLQG